VAILQQSAKNPPLEGNVTLLYIYASMHCINLLSYSFLLMCIATCLSLIVQL